MEMKLPDLQKIRKELVTACKKCDYMNPELTKKLYAINSQIANKLLKGNQNNATS